MKKITTVVCLSIFSFCAFAQEESKEAEVTDAPAKNLVKLNLFALPLKNISMQYERAVARKVTVAATLRFMPKGSIPLKSTFIKLADDPEIERQINNLSVGNFAAMPEVRYYFSKKGAFRGFYTGLFASIANYSADLLYEYDDAGVTKTIPIGGDINTLTGGLMLGSQFKLSKKMYLDWWILGPNYGSSNGKISGQQSLTASEQQSLRDNLATLDVPLTEFTYEVNSNGATLNFKGPWAGVRSGLCIGFRF